MRGSALRAALGVAVVAAVAVGAACGSARSTTGSTVSDVSAARSVAHYTSGTNSDQAAALSPGFNIMDTTGSESHPAVTKAHVDALPKAARALVWTGNLDNTDCTTPRVTTPQFQALVRKLAKDRKVYGYYLSDEPHPLTCTNAVADIRSRSNYVHAHSKFQKTFVVVQDGSGPCGTNLGCEFNALRPARSHLDLIGLDPYPCHYDSTGQSVPCDYGLINDRVSAALSNGVPLRAIVPVFQTFGQERRVGGGQIFYRTPTPDELTTILSTWNELVPKPALDYTYTFGVQCSSTCPAPQALSNHPELQPLMQTHNR